MNIPNEDQDLTLNSAYNPFPEPQTIPSGWDLSGLLSAPHADSEKDQEETTEG